MTKENEKEKEKEIEDYYNSIKPGNIPPAHF